MDTAAVRMGSLAVTVSDSGTVSGNLQANINAKVAGTVSTIQADLGKQVKKGDVLAVLSSSDVDNAETQAELNLKTAQARLDQMLHPASTATPSDISQAQTKVTLAKATLDSRNKDVANLTVKAPVSGNITSLNYQQGDTSSPGSVFATIQDLDHLQFSMAVSSDAVPSVQVGDTTNVVIGPGNESRTGTVTAVDQSGYVSNGQTLFNVTITLDGGFSANVRPGMYGYATLNTRESGGQYAVEGKGTVQSAQSTSVRLSVSGTVNELDVRQGQNVRAGDTLAVLSNDSVTSAALQAQADYDSAVASLSKLTNPPVTATQADIEAQQASVEQAQLTLSLRQQDVANLNITSPIDGVVIAKNINVGDAVGNGGGANATPLFTVADYSKMQVTIDVDELDIAKVQVGQKAAVTADAVPGKNFGGAVVTVAPAGTQAQGVATFPVTISVDNPGDLKTGMTANVNILVAQKDNALLVPIEAVQHFGNRAIVRKMVNGQPTPTPVQTGLANDTLIEITSGLNQGDLVVTGTSTSSAQINPAAMRGLFGGGGEFRSGGGGGFGGNRGGSGGGSGRGN